MSTRIVGFLGIACYDIMHYASRMLKQLTSKVMLIDNSANLALAYSIPGGIESEGTMVDYRGVDFMQGVNNSSIFQNYDYVYIDFGTCMLDKLIGCCDELYFITDYQYHHYIPFEQVSIPNHIARFLIIRDNTPIKLKSDIVTETLHHLNFNSDNTFTLDYSEHDIQAKLLCQHNSIFQFSRISTEFKELLFAMLTIDFDRKELQQTFKIAARGV